MNEITTSPTALAAPALSKASFKPLAQCQNLGEAFASIEFKDRIAAAAPSHIKPGRLLQTFIGAVSKNPLLRECSVRSYIGACLTLSQTGFEANTALGHAYLIPFRESKWNPVTRSREPVGVNINVIFGYPGLIDLSYRTGLVRNIHPDIVFPGDEFSFEYGSNAHLKHVPRQRRDGDVPLFAYMHAALKDGQAFEVMPYSEVLRIRDKAQAYRYALEAKEKAEAEGKRLPPSWTEAPWVAHEFPMARKTLVRAGSKWLPRSVELYSALALEDAQERGRGIDFGSVLEAPTIDGTTDYLSAAADAELRDDPPPVDPGTAHGIRSANTTQTNVPDKAAIAREQQALAKKAAEIRKPKDSPPEDRFADDPGYTPTGGTTAGGTTADRPATTPATTASSNAPTFEAVLIDVAGDVMGEPFTNPVLFAGAFVKLWHESEGNAALREFNEDAITELEAHPQAGPILAACFAVDPNEDEPTDEDEPDGVVVRLPVKPLPVAVEPPVERGKTSWPGYVKLLKAALMQVDQAEFGTWAAAQRDTLERCPTAQRVLAIRAIAETAGMRQVDQPLWLSDLVKKQPAAAATNPPAADPVEPVTDADERWVNNRIAEIADPAMSRDQFDQLVGSGAVRTMMARLRRDKRELFDRADAAFSVKHQSLPPAPETV